MIPYINNVRVWFFIAPAYLSYKIKPPQKSIEWNEQTIAKFIMHKSVYRLAVDL